MKYDGIVISDIHFGAFDTLQMMEELNKVFIPYLERLKKLDFIIIDGDYFDHKIYLSDKISDYAISFMKKLVDHAKQFHCPIRCVYGTESHEVNQYHIFSIYENDPDLDFKVIYSVEEEELKKDLMVLYLPEEVMLDKKEYYKEYFTKKEKYDYIFGHGVIQEVMTDAVKHTSSNKDSKRKKVPYFTSAELEFMCRGQVYFGHYHVMTNIKNKIFYVGSYSRWKHGEDTEKGFFHISCDTTKRKYSQDFIENTYAKKYHTYNYGYLDPVMVSEKDLIAELEKRDKWTEAQGDDYVKYVFNIPEDHPNPEAIIQVLNERYKFNDRINVKIVNGYVEKKKKANKEKFSELVNEYPLIFDKMVKLEDKIEYYIKKKYEREVPLENIKLYLYGDMEENVSTISDVLKTTKV